MPFVILFSRSKEKRIARRNSYSQFGEDMLIASFLLSKGITDPDYMDIGAYDPYKFSNTAYLYEQGSRGINIEANAERAAKIEKARPGDITLNIGVGPENGELDFFIMNASVLNTFSREQAERLEREFGKKIRKVVKVPVMRIRDIVDRYAGGVFPVILTIDAEGMDLEILRDIDYDDNYPRIICAETREYAEKLEGTKDEELIGYLKSKGYAIVGETGLNTIFYKE